MLHALVQLGTEAAAGGSDPLRALAEYPRAGETAWVIDRDEHGEVRARPVEVDDSDDPLKSRRGFAFRKPSGPRGAQLGLVMKRSFSPDREAMPGRTILELTFRELTAVTGDGAETIQRALALLGDGSPTDRADRYIALRETITSKGTVFVSLGPPPAHDPSYARHYLGRINALYDIDASSPVRACDLCGLRAPVSDKALAAAKVNFLNRDNHGVFPGFDEGRACDRYALCARCAGAITTAYIERKDDLRVAIAGEPALLLPYVQTPDPAPESSRTARDLVTKAKAGTGTAVIERDLLDVLAEERSLACFHLLWAKAGDRLDEVSGFLTDVPCTRLGVVSAHNQHANRWREPAFPRHPVRDFDLRLSIVGEILQHPGGARVRGTNEGRRRAALRRRVVRAVFLGAPFDPSTLYAEARALLANHIADATPSPGVLAWSLTHEATPKRTPKGTETPLTAAGRARHLALLLHYLRTLPRHAQPGDPPMFDEPRFTPESPRLRPYFTAPTGIDSDARAFAFLVGVVFGRLVAIQGARGVNVRSNALAWLRRATLRGEDLPALVVKIRAKFLEYEAERSAALREVLHDLGTLGQRLGTRIPLDADAAMYFLFLGQSLSGDVFAKDEDSDRKESQP